MSGGENGEAVFDTAGDFGLIVRTTLWINNFFVPTTFILEELNNFLFFCCVI